MSQAEGPRCVVVATIWICSLRFSDWIVRFLLLSADSSITGNSKRKGVIRIN